MATYAAQGRRPARPPSLSGPRASGVIGPARADGHSTTVALAHTQEAARWAGATRFLGTSGHPRSPRAGPGALRLVLDVPGRAPAGCLRNGGCPATLQPDVGQG